jgi:hypothetical protein
MVSVFTHDSGPGGETGGSYLEQEHAVSLVSEEEGMRNLRESDSRRSLLIES